MAKPNSDLLRGTLELLILQILRLGASHGYAIGQEIEKLTGNVVRIEQGSLYPALYRMEKRGWLKSRWRNTDSNRRAKFYELTRQGKRRLEAEAESWTEFVAAVSNIIPTK